MMMTQRRYLARIAALSLSAVLALSACDKGGAGGAGGDPLAKVAAPAGQSWSQKVTATADGFVMGNPDAPIKLVEFGAYTCPTCAAFSVDSHEQLKADFVDTGRVSFEFRPFVLSNHGPLDLALATTAMCAGPERFFPLTENLFANQQAFFAAADAAGKANAAAMANVQSLPENQRLVTIARLGGLHDFLAARGISTAETDRCLSDVNALKKRLEATERSAKEHEITGTPSFLINGELVPNASSWELIREALRAAGAR